MSFGAVGGAIAGSVVSGMLGGDKEETSSSQQVTNIQEDESITRYLDISDEAVDKIVSDILGSEKGIADIFSKENVAGLYNSTVSAQASGDLVANLAGEIAKLRAVEHEDRDLTRVQVGNKEGEKETDVAFDFNAAIAGGALGAEYGEAAGIAVGDFFSPPSYSRTNLPQLDFDKL